MNGIWDVLIVGAGPAGSISGYLLAKGGLKVAILDKSRFPRTKACGGGVQIRASRNIPYDWTSVVKSRIDKAEFSFRCEDRHSKSNFAPIVNCVLRSEFDEFLVRAAQDAGAVLLENVRSYSIVNQGSKVLVNTSVGSMQARYVIGADGANSIVCRELNKRTDFYWQVAVFAELSASVLPRRFVSNDIIRMDFGSLPSGYAWVFPKGDKVNIGAGAPSVLGKHLRQYFRRFVLSEGIANSDTLSTLKLQGHYLPTLTSRTKVSGRNLFLVGDAAGLVEPLTGEGISYACQSAACVAETIIAFFNDAGAEEQYSRVLHAQVSPDINWARRLLTLSVGFPRLVYWLMQHRESVWDLLCLVLRGERSFKELHNEVLGPLALLQRPIDYFCGKLEEKRVLWANAKGVLSTEQDLYGKLGATSD